MKKVKKIQLSDSFSYRKLLAFTLPSIIMMVFTSIYGVVDGFFISNFVGITQFSATNLIMPFVQILGAVGFMFGTGGSALVAKTLGEGDKDRANAIFSLLTYIGIGVGVALAVIGIAIVRPVAGWLGADEELMPYCVTYASIVLVTLPAYMLQNMFQSFLVTAERPTLGLVVTVAAGLTNMTLDALFVIVFEWGVVGAAVATCIAQCVGGFVPLVYFACKNSSLLRLGGTKYNGRTLLSSCINGSSELVSNISMSVVAILYNYQLMRFAGKDGVAAYGAVMYVSFIFVAVFVGYSIGVAPVIGYHHGADNSKELKSLFKKSNILVAVASLVFSAAAFLLAEPLARVFLGSDAVAQDPRLLELTVGAFRYYALSVLFCGFTIFGSAFFTALNDGIVSAAISFLRTLVFQVASVLILPIFFEIDGVWYSIFVAEIFAVIVTFVFFVTKKKKYKY